MAIPSTAAIYLFRISAAINAISVPGHIAFGVDNVNPTLNTLKATQAQRTAAAGSANGWDYMNAGFATLGKTLLSRTALRLLILSFLN